MGRSGRTRRKTDREIVDLLGYLVLWCWALWVLLIWLAAQALCLPEWMLFPGGAAAAMCCARIVLYRRTPKQERRVYRRMEPFYGADQLIHPYTQSAFTIFFFAACVVRLLSMAGA